MALGIGLWLWGRGGQFPALALDLSGTTALDSRVTFTRASTGTYFNSAGILSTATTNTARFDYDPSTAVRNLHTGSGNLIAAAEGGSGSFTASATTTTAPDGTTLAKLSVSTTSSAHRTIAAISGANSGIHTFSTYVKPAEYSVVGLRVYYAATNASAIIDVATGIKSLETNGLIYSEALANGWYRVSFVTSSAITPTQANIYVMDSASRNMGTWAGDGASGLYLWGAQLEQSGYAGTYVATTSAADQNFASALGMLVEEQRVNYCVQSNFAGTWQINGSVGTLTGSAVLSPDGTQNGSTYTGTGGAGAYKGIFETTALPIGAGTFSVFAKMGTSRWVIIDVFDNTVNYDVWFDLQNGVVGTAASGSTGTIKYVGNGWYRLTHTRTMAAANASVGLYLADADNTTTSTGALTASYFGAQGESAAFATSYIPTTTVAVTRAADVPSMTGTTAALFATSTGTILAETRQVSATSGARIVGTSGGQAPLYMSSGAPLSWDGSNATTAPDALDWLGSNKIALAWGGGASSIVADNGTVATGTEGAGFSTITTVYLGSAGGTTNFLNGHIYSLAVYGSKLPDATLQTLTTYTPDIDWDLTTALPTGATFTRASTATYTDINGVIQTAAINAARFDYSAGVAKGLMVEEARTNLAIRSQEFDNAAWTKANATAGANAATAPDGTLTADALIPNAGSNAANFNTTTTISTTAQAYTYSVYVKKGTLGTDWFQMIVSSTTAYRAWFNLTTGAKGSLTSATGSNITALGNGWYRCDMLIPTTNGSGAILYVAPDNANGANGSVTGDGTSPAFYLWGAQFEAGSFSTSYIPTTTVAVTRAADSLSVTGPYFASWWTGDRGTFAYEGDEARSGGYLMNVSDGTAANRILTYNSGSTVDMVASSASTLVVNSSIAAYAAGAQKIALAFAKDDFAATIAGGTVATDTSAALPIGVTRLTLGASESGFSSYLNGHVSRFKFWRKKRLPNSTLVRIST